MEIKIVCPCGTKYQFAVEPVNERMPLPVSCPQCGADGTAEANEILKQGLPFADDGNLPAPPAILPPPARPRQHPQ